MSLHPHHLTRRSLLGSTAAALVALAAGAAPRRSAAAGRLDPTNPTAQALGYAPDGASTQRPSAGQRCAGCMHFGGNGDDWGPCAIFQGQLVNSNGWCRAFTAR